MFFPIHFFLASASGVASTARDILPIAALSY